MSKPSRPRLLVCATDFPPDQGGIQRLLHELAIRLCERWEVTAIAPAHPRSAPYDEDAPFRVLRTRASWQGSRFGTLLEMTRLARRERPEVSLAAHINALPPALVGGRGARTAALIHGSELWAPRTRLIARTLGRRLDCAMAVSRFTAEQAVEAGIPRERVAVTALGASAPLGVRDDGLLTRMGLARDGRPVPFFLTVSRLAEEHKGQDTFIRAMPVLLARHPDARYVIAGDGERGRDLSRLAAEVGVADAVLMPGAIDEATKAELMRSCRAYVMVSRELRRPALFEGFGIAYIEAALAGRPSLAGRSGGVADAIVDDVTGVLVDPTSVEAVTHAAMRFLDDPAYGDTLGEHARVRAEADYTWDAAVGRIERCLEAVLA